MGLVSGDTDSAAGANQPLSGPVGVSSGQTLPPMIRHYLCPCRSTCLSASHGLMVLYTCPECGETVEHAQGYDVPLRWYP